MTPPALPPGFMVIHGNRPESLRDLLVNWTTRYPLAPLENETILVQSNGIAQWLRLALARDEEEGGCGIAAALDMQLPSRFIWQAYRAVLGEHTVPATSPFDRSLLVWRLMRLLPALLAEAPFAPLRRFLERDADLRRRHQLAERLADLLDQYQVYRADWLAAWAAGDDRIDTRRQGRQPLPDTLMWQPHLWRALLADVGPAQAGSSRAAVHQRFLAAVAAQAGQPLPVGLPRRLLVFGISSLPQQALEVLAAVAGWTQVLMCVHNPCQHHWAHIVADKDLLRATRSRQGRRAGTPGDIDDSLLHLHAHPLLAAWGRQGRDFINLLDVHDEREQYEQRFIAIDQRIDLFESPSDPSGETGLLQQLQDDILDLRPLAETRERWPGVDPRADRSLRFHIAHGPQREVEILHDQLLAAFAADPSLRPRDIIVMVPDINAYAPHVQAVFGLLETADPRHIPFTLADQGQRHHDPLLGALEKILALPQSRLAVSDLLDLLEVPALRARFGIGDDQLPLLHRWVRKANIRWGLHAEHRASLDLPQAPGQNSWAFGLRRMLLGYAVGAGEAWQGVEPLDEIGGLDAALLGPLVRLLDSLDQTWRTLAHPATPPEWGERLRGLLQGFFLADEGRDGFTLLRLESGLQDWLDACTGAALHEALPLSVVREHWLALLDQSSLTLPFFAGAVTFATLMPMRAIPFRRVCLLGMNDGDYPRTRVPMDFDLMGRDYRPGDRSRREDDRYLFLEAVLSARDHLHISWVGRSIHDHSERPPSVLVAQLRDHIAAGWRLAGDEAPVREAGAALLEALTTEHRLQPFSRAYFTGTGDEGLFSYAREWRDGLAPSPASAGEAHPVTPSPASAGEAHPMTPSPASAGEAHPMTPSPASAGEGGGEGRDLRIPPASANTSNAPHPNPLPLMRERESAGVPLMHWREGDLPPFRWDAELTIALLSDFLRDPVRAFFQQRLRVHFETADPVSEDQEPFALDALENWQLQDELIHAQLAAPARGVAREAALAAQMERIQRRGELPAGQFAAAVAAGLAAPMADLFARHDQALAEWPEPADDEALELDQPAGTPPLRVADWLGKLRRNARGERGRVQLSSTGLLKDQQYRRDKLVPYWVAHLAGHLNGEPLTTVIVSKNGDVRLPPLPVAQARQHWDDLLQAWQQGMHRPLPLALRTAFAWLQKGGMAGQGPDTEAGRAARACYEVHDPEHLRFAECEESPYLGRAYPGFDHLWADGAFAHWADRLLRPLSDALGSARAGRPAVGAGA